MQVTTLNQDGLNAAAARLASAVAEGCRGQRYDAVIGIRRGGAYVCDAFMLSFPASLCGERHDVTLQRPGTRRKGRLMSAILKRLPVKVLDMMRLAESRILSLRSRHAKEKEPPQVGIDSGLAAIVCDTAAPRLLLIDDAIDSGHTLSEVIATLKKMNPSARVETAVITETTENPLVRADYTIYRNRTLIRFPWSNDFKDTRKAPHS